MYFSSTHKDAASATLSCSKIWLWTRKVLCGSFLCAIDIFLIHSFIHAAHASGDAIAVLKLDHIIRELPGYLWRLWRHTHQHLGQNQDTPCDWKSLPPQTFRGPGLQKWMHPHNLENKNNQWRASLVEFMHLVFTCIPSESYCRQFRSLLFVWCLSGVNQLPLFAYCRLKLGR